MVGVLDNNETCWFLVSHKKGTQDDTALAHKPGECTTSYTTHHISLIYKITGHVAIISSFQASFQQENQRRINHPEPNFPHPTASQIATVVPKQQPEKCPCSGEVGPVPLPPWWMVQDPCIAMVASKAATYLKSEHGVMRVPIVWGISVFFPMNMATYWGSTSFQTRPRCVEWPLIAMSVPNTLAGCHVGT